MGAGGSEFLNKLKALIRFSQIVPFPDSSLFDIPHLMRNQFLVCRFNVSHGMDLLKDHVDTAERIIE